MLYTIGQQIWETQQQPQDWKRSVFIPILKKGSSKEYSEYRTIALISHASKVMLKILQGRLQQYVNWELPDVQLDLKKAEELKIKLPTSFGSQKKQGNSKKKFTSASLTMLKTFDCVDCNKLENSRDNTRPPYLPPEKPICWSRSNS